MSSIQAKILLDKYAPASNQFEVRVQRAILKLVAAGKVSVRVVDGEIMIEQVKKAN